jgi:colanic acid/amylovoran biosynthesis glycosyltransferase
MTHRQTRSASISRRASPEQAITAPCAARQGLRVLFVLGEFPSISETFVLDQITGLIDRGSDVAVIARRPRAPSPEHRAVMDYDLRTRTRYYPDTLRRRWGARRELATWFDVAPTEVARALARSLRLDLYGLDGLALGPLQRAVAARDAGPVDAIVAHFGPNGLKALGLRELGITAAPIVTLFHGHDLSRWTKRHGPLGYRRLFARTELMLAISEHGRARLIALGCPPEKVRVHRMGVNSPEISPTPLRPASAPDEDIHVLSVGRLVEKKGFEFALHAIRQGLGAHPNLRYHLVGDGPLRASLEALAAALAIAHRVTFHGQLARDGVDAIRQRADLVLVPSVTASDGDEEGIPVVLMEAMAAGVAVIATHHGGIPELVVDEETGLLVPERDSEALAHALRRLIDDAPLRARLARGARALVLRQHDLERQNDELATLLDRVAHERRL